MKDRTPTKPGRVQLVPVTGQANLYDMSMADEPTEVGTALNKANLLSDAAVAAVWPSSAPADPVPSDAFAQLAGLAQKQLCDFTNTASISSSASATITLSDNIENYKMLDIWAISGVTPSGGVGAIGLYMDVGNTVDSNNRIGNANLKTSATPNPIHLVTLIVDNSSNGHLVLSDISRGYRSSDYPDPNVAYTGTGKLEGNKITVSADTSISSGKLRVIIIGTKIN